MFFFKKQKTSLVEAIVLVHDATEIAYAYKRDADYVPTKQELHQFWQLENALSESYTALRHISCAMMQRGKQPL